MERLGPNFSLSRMLVVDFMHEFELGVWRTLFIHLIRIRILHGAAPGAHFWMKGATTAFIICIISWSHSQ